MFNQTFMHYGFTAELTLHGRKSYMRMNRFNKLALGITLLACTLPAGLVAQAADATPAPAAAPAAAPAPPPNPLAGVEGFLSGVNMSGLVDVYYQYNSDNPKDGTFTTPFTPYNKQFALNLIEFQLDKPVDKTTPLGFRMTFGYGEAANVINSTDTAIFLECKNISGPPEGIGCDSTGTDYAKYLKEGYLSYFAPVGKGLQIDVGKFVTPAGVEVIETNQNWNYTRGLLFSWAIPYYHMGVRAKYTFNDKLSVTGIVANGWNNILSTNSGKTFGFTGTYNATKKIAISETYLTGPRDLLQDQNNGSWNNFSDTVVTFNPTAKLSLAGEFDYDHQGLSAAEAESVGVPAADYTGFGAFAKYAVNTKWAAAGRYEYLNDHDGLAFFGPFHNHMYEVTGTLERTLAGHLITRLEYRFDHSNQPYFFEYGSDSARGTQQTVTLGMVYALP